MQMSNDSDQTHVNREQTPPSDQQAQTVVERRPVERQPILTAETPVPVRRTVEPVKSVETVEPIEAKSNNLSEFIKFGILAVILLGTPLVIWLLNPIIFGQIVPAVLGSDLPPSLPGDQIIQPSTAETPNVVLPTDPQTGIGGEATPTPLPPQETPANPAFHIVRSGDTLNSIARQYGLTVDDIAAANNLADLNQIFSGQVLILPPQSSP
jgi:LysM repeat protein